MSLVRLKVWFLIIFYIVFWFIFIRLNMTGIFELLPVFILMLVIILILFIRCENCKRPWHGVGLETSNPPDIKELFLLPKSCPKCGIKRF
jgi:cell division protein FtsW (lipid II flippase)